MSDERGRWTLGGHQCDNMTLIAIDLARRPPGSHSRHRLHPHHARRRLTPPRWKASAAAPGPRAGDLSEDEIERAIREINAAIHKFK